MLRLRGDANKDTTIKLGTKLGGTALWNPSWARLPRKHTKSIKSRTHHLIGGQAPCKVRCLEQQILEGIVQQQAEVCKLLCGEAVVVHVNATTMAEEVLVYVHERANLCAWMNDRVSRQCGAADRPENKECSKLDRTLTGAPDSYGASLGEAQEDADIEVPVTAGLCTNSRRGALSRSCSKLVMRVAVK